MGLQCMIMLKGGNLKLVLKGIFLGLRSKTNALTNCICPLEMILGHCVGMWAPLGIFEHWI